MFIYVMDEESKQYLEELGYTLIQEDPVHKVWCFKNQYSNQMDFSLKIPCVISDIMMF